jgi:hypothetical protein
VRDERVSQRTGKMIPFRGYDRQELMATSFRYYDYQVSKGGRAREHEARGFLKILLNRLFEYLHIKPDRF